MENCQPIPPKAVSMMGLKTQSKDARILIINDQIFERASWASSDWAPRDQYVDMFCQGEDPTVGKAIERTVDLFVFISPISVPMDIPWMPFQMDNQILLRTGYMQVSDISVQTQQIVNTQQLSYSIQETMMMDPFGGYQHSLQFYGGSTTSLFTMEFLNPNNFNFFIPSNFNYGTSPSLLKDVKSPMCWSMR